MAISPPTERLWWKTPIHRPELIWIIVAFLWGLVMFFMMIYWHAFGQQNLATETYRTTPNAFYAKTEAMVQQYRVRDINGLPVVRPVARRRARDSCGAGLATTLPWRPSRRFIPTIATSGTQSADADQPMNPA